MSPWLHDRSAGSRSGYPRLAKLAELPVDIVQSVAVGIAVGQRAAMGDTRPFRAPAGQEKLEIMARAAGGLQVVDPVEPAVDQPPPQPQPAGEVPPVGGRSSIQISSNQGDGASQAA